MDQFHVQQSPEKILDEVLFIVNGNNRRDLFNGHNKKETQRTSCSLANIFHLNSELFLDFEEVF